MIAFITTFLYIAGFVCAGHAILTTRTAQGAIAWSVALVSLPFVAVPAYLVFGRNKFEGMVDAYEAKQDEIDGLIADIHAGLEPWTHPTPSHPSVYRALNKLSGFGIVRGNSVQLLVDGEATFDSILDGLSQAEDYILLQFYMIHDDGIGGRIRDVLVERAAAGIPVLVLYDEIGSQGLPRSYVDSLREAGVEVSSFRPTQGLGNRFQLNFRNHRKIVVVDGKSAWIGGHNIGDEYLGLDPEFSPWRDTHVRIDGPAAVQLQAVVLGDWYWATRELPNTELGANACPRLGYAGHDHAISAEPAPRNCRPDVHHGITLRAATNLDIGALLRTGRGCHESAGTCGTARGGCARHNDRQSGQSSCLPRSFSLHQPASRPRHSFLCLYARLPARKSHVD